MESAHSEEKAVGEEILQGCVCLSPSLTVSLSEMAQVRGIIGQYKVSGAVA